jgi:tetratricopeptide (TPR) repeat protein
VVSEDEFDHPPRHARPSLYDEPYSVPRRRRVGGWIVALSLLLAVGVVGWAVAKPYLVAQGAAAAAQLDPRAQSFLVQGESAMSDGSLDVAQEDFDKASVLAEKDPRVLLDRARVTAARADLPWLKLRLLTPDAADETRITQAQLDELVARARRQADDAFTASPNDFAALCARVDSLRLSGDREAARALAGRMTGQGLKPETAYVLAALDLAEPSPLWSTVIERLRLAASAEGNAGRARSALIYALVRAGDVAGARAELARLDLLARPYALLANLHAFVDRAVPAAESKPSALASASARAGLGRASTSAPPGPTAAPPGVAAAGTDSVGDPRNAMALAGLALKKGDFARARQVYEGIVDRNPADSEAIAGLGDVARLQGDPAGAMASYKHAIAINPSYLPALIGLADTQWSGGDHESAVRTYNSIVDRFPEGTYPGYVSQRLAVSQAKPADSPPASSAATSEAADRQGQ